MTAAATWSESWTKIKTRNSASHPARLQRRIPKCAEHRPAQSRFGRDLSAALSGNAAAQAESGSHCRGSASHAAPYHGIGFRNRRRGCHARNLSTLSLPAPSADIAIAKATSSAARADFRSEPRPLSPDPAVRTATVRVSTATRAFRPKLRHQRRKPGMRFTRRRALPPARITTTITTITTISRADSAEARRNGAARQRSRERARSGPHENCRRRQR